NRAASVGADMEAPWRSTGNIRVDPSWASRRRELTTRSWAGSGRQDRACVGRWPALMTRPECPRTVEKPVQMMFMKSIFKMTYIVEISTQILVLPYEGQELNMVILLPSKTTDLNTVEKALTYEKFVEWTKPDVLAEDEVVVLLPRFTLEESYDMEGVLRDLGMTDAFDAALADFTGMSSGQGLHLSKVVHKSFVEVTEEGTEAAAATSAGPVMRCLRIVPRFCADRPFLFFIQHGKTGAIL
ncbi:hypothetical protein FD755_026008, partial [Muntiacus reevesi]